MKEKVKETEDKKRRYMFNPSPIKKQNRGEKISNDKVDACIELIKDDSHIKYNIYKQTGKKQRQKPYTKIYSVKIIRHQNNDKILNQRVKIDLQKSKKAIRITADFSKEMQSVK